MPKDHSHQVYQEAGPPINASKFSGRQAYL